MDKANSIMSELQFHLKRLSNPLSLNLEKCVIENQWETKDYFLIIEDLDVFLTTCSSTEETFNELLYLMAKLLFFSGQLDKLNDLYIQYASIEEIHGIQIFYALGLSFQGHSQQGLEIIDQVYNTLDENDTALYLETLGIELFIHSIKRDYKKVTGLFKKFQVTLNENVTLTREEIAHILPWAYLRNAYSLRAEGQITSAMDLITECGEYLRDFPHRFFKVMAATLMGHCYHNVGNIAKAIEFYDEAIDIGLEIQSKTLLSILYNRVGMAMSIRRKFEESRTYYQDALDLAIETGSTWLTAGPLASLSQWKIANGNIEGAIDDYHHFEEVASSVGDERELCFAQLALANLYERLGDFPKSKYYFSEGLRRGLKLGILKLSPNESN
ncbi:MAG: tetratricopeptide repeat protein [Candidatus Hodarchaeales archaeon]|jgi:tetratricopeptide (TPR) repeat protein